MTRLNLTELRPRLDLENKYVDFGILRASLSVLTVVKDLETNLTEASKDGECRAICPKCGKERSFALNINTNRFNCFAKGCVLKGGGVIDFVAKLFEVPAKEASHLLACAYGVSPYTQERVSESQPVKPRAADKPPVAVKSEQSNRSKELVSREEFDDLQEKVERLSMIVWSQIFESGEIEETDNLFDEPADEELKETLAALTA